MTLSRSSRIVRWAYWYDYRPRRTSLCVLFWRVVLIAPAAVLIATGTIPIWGTVMLWQKYGQVPYQAWRQRRNEVAWEKQQARWRQELVHNPPDPSALKILWLGLVSLKKKVCPIITFYR